MGTTGPDIEPRLDRRILEPLRLELESVVNGVQLIAWPLYAEQRMNAFMLNQDVKVAPRPKTDENGVVQRRRLRERLRLTNGGA